MKTRIPTAVLDRGPHKGTTVLGREVAGQVGALRLSTKKKAAEEAEKLGSVTTEILEETKEVFRDGVAGPGPIFWIAITGQNNEEKPK